MQNLQNQDSSNNSRLIQSIWIIFGIGLFFLFYSLFTDWLNYKGQCGSSGWMSAAFSCSFWQYFIAGNGYNFSLDFLAIATLFSVGFLLLLIYLVRLLFLKK
jgi:hypothetical protein